MIHLIRDYLITIREMRKQVKTKRVKDAMYRVLVGKELNYLIIRDLINAARYDVKIDVVLKDGSRMTIQRDDAFDKLQKPGKTELY